MVKRKLTAALLALLLLGGGTSVNAEVLSPILTNYKVVSGDSLWLISKTYNTTVDSIIKLNSLATTVIREGQILTVEDNRIQTTIYKVVSGDTLWLISKKYNTTVDTITKLNNLQSTVLQVGQELRVPVVAATPTQAPIPATIQTVNYVVQLGDNLWTLAQKYKTTMDAIMKSNMLVTDEIMPNQTLTIPVNSTAIVKPVGITMYMPRVNNTYGDIYTWENAMRLFTVDTKGTLKDLQTGIIFDVKYYGGSNHADVVPLTKADTDKIRSLFPVWSWSARRPMILMFSKGGTYYQMAVSLTGMPHSTTNIYDNGMEGHMDLYFYNSTSHNTNELSPEHQANVMKASGR